MKTLILIFIVLLLQPVASCTSGDGAGRKEVQKAYETRLNGHADEAMGILNTLLSEDSTLALAYYELARTQWYMVTGGGQASDDDILASLDKAVTYDPTNVGYAYTRAIAVFFKAFISMQRESEQVAEDVATTCRAYEEVLKLKPDHRQAMLYLVELYGMLPPDMGGDSLKGAHYAAELAKLDDYYGAKARLDLSPEGTDPVAFWTDYLTTHEKNATLLSELGKACLATDKPEEAEKYFNEAMALDASRNILLLDIARYHLMQVMRDKETADKELPLSVAYFEKYLSSTPAPIIPLKAYAIGWLSRIHQFQGDQAGAEKLTAEAKALDPYFSRVTGIPGAFLFDPPEKENERFFSFFSFY
jgi:tetratricopeptide (TPR) repeat protein